MEEEIKNSLTADTESAVSVSNLYVVSVVMSYPCLIKYLAWLTCCCSSRWWMCDGCEISESV